MKRILNLEKYTTTQILILIAGIIIVCPIILTLPAIIDLFDFSNKGSIGDTIGGITAPFINGLAAVLVFLAFKEQIKANEIFKNQEKSKILLEQINTIQRDDLKIEQVIRITSNQIDVYRDRFSAIEANNLNKLQFFITEFKLAFFLLENLPENKEFYYKKLYFIYIVLYRDLFLDLDSQFEEPFVNHADYSIYIRNLRSSISDINQFFNDINRFSKN